MEGTLVTLEELLALDDEIAAADGLMSEQEWQGFVNEYNRYLDERFAMDDYYADLESREYV